MAELYLIRHGQASLGADNYDQLSVQGYSQADVLAAYFAARDIQFDAHISGDMQRHKQTIQPLLGDKDLHIVSGWNEFDFEAVIRGYLVDNPTKKAMLSKDRRSLYKLLKEAMLAWSQNRINAELPESWQQFTSRVNEAANQLRMSSHKRIVVASSGGAIAAFIGHIFDLTPSHIVNLNLQIKNASIQHFFFSQNGFQMSTFNSVAHLDQPEHRHLITYS